MKLKYFFHLTFYFLLLHACYSFGAEKITASYATAVQVAGPAVVNIYATRESLAHPYAASADQRELITPEPNTQYRLGSGVIMDNRGYILTSNHLILDAKRVLVVLDNGRKTVAEIVGRDPETDLIVLKINIKNIHAIRLGNSNNLQVGDIVLAIGNPFGLGQTVTQGIISAIGRSTIGSNTLGNYIQTDAAINPGSSGGALINTHGELVGINSAIYTRSGGYQGVAFAVPVNVAVNVMNQIIKFGTVKRGWLGVEVSNNHDGGVIITSVAPKSPAETYGLKADDIIVYVNNNRIHNVANFINLIAEQEPEQIIKITILRKEQTMVIPVKITAKPTETIVVKERSLKDDEGDWAPDNR